MPGRPTLLTAGMEASPMTADRERADGAPGKVARLLERYGLEGFGDHLVASWRGEGAPKRSLRDLADHVNRRLLAAALEDVGEDVGDGEVEAMYARLADGGDGAADRTATERRLARAGVDVEGLVADFVSRQAVHTYLTKHRGVESPDSGASPTERRSRRADVIGRLRNRLAAVTQQSLESLDRAGAVSVGETDVIVSVSVHCADCGTTADVVDLLDAGGCACGADVPGGP